MKSNQMMVLAGLSVLMIGGVWGVEVITNSGGPKSAEASTSGSIAPVVIDQSDAGTSVETIETPNQTEVTAIIEEPVINISEQFDSALSVDLLDTSEVTVASDPVVYEPIVIDSKPYEGSLSSGSGGSGVSTSDESAISSSGGGSSVSAPSDVSSGGGGGGDSSSGGGGGGDSSSGGGDGSSSDGSVGASPVEGMGPSLNFENHKNSQAVREVLSGKRKVANAAWWGFNKYDASHALQSAISSGATTVLVPNMGSDWIVRPIFISSNQEIILEEGVVITAKKGLYDGQNTSLFYINNKENVKIQGYGATLKMQKAEYMRPGFPEGESRMVITIFDSKDIEICGLTLRDSGGDGIFIGTDARKKYGYCENIIVKDCICDNNYRQGISVTSAKNVLIDNCVFKNTSGTNPSAGIDLEPSHYTHKLSNIVISNCTSENNDGAGFAVYLKHLSSKTEEISVLFVNCLVRSCGSIGRSGIIVGAINSDGPKGLIEFNNCTIEDIKEPGLCIFDKYPTSALVRFVDCTWSNVAQNRQTKYLGFTAIASPIYFFVREPKLSNLIGGVEFVNCTVYDNNDRPTISVLSRGKQTQNISGLLNVHTSFEPKIWSDYAAVVSQINVRLIKQVPQ